MKKIKLKDLIGLKPLMIGQIKIGKVFILVTSHKCLHKNEELIG